MKDCTFSPKVSRSNSRVNSEILKRRIDISDLGNSGLDLENRLIKFSSEKQDRLERMR